MHHQRCHFPVPWIEPDGIELIGKRIFLLEMQIHKILLRAVHEGAMLFQFGDELLIQPVSAKLKM